MERRYRVGPFMSPEFERQLHQWNKRRWVWRIALAVLVPIAIASWVVAFR